LAGTFSFDLPELASLASLASIGWPALDVPDVFELAQAPPPPPAPPAAPRARTSAEQEAARAGREAERVRTRVLTRVETVGRPCRADWVARATDVDELYACGRRALDRRDWDVALQAFTKAAAAREGSRSVGALYWRA